MYYLYYVYPSKKKRWVFYLIELGLNSALPSLSHIATRSLHLRMDMRLDMQGMMALTDVTVIKR